MSVQAKPPCDVYVVVVCSSALALLPRAQTYRLRTSVASCLNCALGSTSQLVPLLQRRLHDQQQCVS